MLAAAIKSGVPLEWVLGGIVTIGGIAVTIVKILWNKLNKAYSRIDELHDKHTSELKELSTVVAVNTKVLEENARILESSDPKYNNAREDTV